MNETNTTDQTDTKRTLTVRIGTPDEAFDQVEEQLAAIDEGREPEPLFEIVLQHEDDLQRLLSPKNIELLCISARDEPTSI